MGDTRDLALILDSKIAIVAIESPDEKRVLALLMQFAMQRGLKFYEWSATRGLRRGDLAAIADGPCEHTEPEEALKHIAATKGPALYALCDLHPYLKDSPRLVRYLKDVALDYDALGSTLVLVSHAVTVPAELKRFTASFELRLPSDDELRAMVRSEAQAWAKSNAGRKVRTDAATLDALIANLRGVSHADAQVLIRRAIFADGVIGDEDLPDVNRLKFELMDADGVLRYEHDTSSFAEVAGLTNLKAWLGLRREPFLTANTQDRPRGILLIGVQGSGKSLAAKAVAGLYGVPLLRLDFGALYNKYFGETERNVRSALSQAEAMAPCVLWMDEIEKGLATGDGDNATSKRVLGTLLTWMAENKKSVFLVATSNDISQLPPELMRKGRIDEVFFVDLPDRATRAEIFRIHLARRKLDPARFDVEALAAESEGFTGAEIEEALVSARYLTASKDAELSTSDVRGALHRTYPLSVVRADAIAAIRAWAQNRTVPA